MNFNNLLSLEFTSDNIALIKLNAQELPTNLLTHSFLKAYQQAIETAFANEQIIGAIVLSEKRDFIAGGDLKAFVNPTQTKAEVFADIVDMHKIMRSVELKQKPIVAAINGNALGGGLEFALACQYRIALDNDAIRIGLPEVNLGLIPGGGGTQRLMRIIGLQEAMTNILQCKLLTPKAALKAGFIHEVAADMPALLEAAKAFILKNPIASQPWDIKGFKIPKGGVNNPAAYGNMAGSIGNLRKQTHGHYPGATAALSALYDGSLINNIDKALETEARYFVQALFSKEAHNLIKTGFFALNEAKKGKSRPAHMPKTQFHTIGIIGAGFMGTSLAFAALKANLKVTLLDQNLENIQKAQTQIQGFAQAAIAANKLSEAQAQTLLTNLTITTNISDLAHIPFIIESVNEDLTLKQDIIGKLYEIAEGEIIIASNTSTLPIKALAKKAIYPSQVIGMHFFAPIDKMPLVEVVKTEKTSDLAIATAIDFTLLLGKTPVLVNDAPGFFTTRVLSAFLSEAALMVKEGIKPVLIENSAKSAGFAVGPLAIIDELSLSLILHMLKAKLASEKSAFAEELVEVYESIISNSGTGKKSGKGFYEYFENGEKQINKDLQKLFPTLETQPSKEIVAARLFAIMALEAYKAMEENIIEHAKDGDVASVIGFGFPAYTGGVISYINYIGVAQFVDNCKQLELAYGQRFAMPTSLIALAETKQPVLI